MWIAWYILTSAYIIKNKPITCFVLFPFFNLRLTPLSPHAVIVNSPFYQ